MEDPDFYTDIDTPGTLAPIIQQISFDTKGIGFNKYLTGKSIRFDLVEIPKEK